MSVFKRCQCKGCGRTTEEPRPQKKSPPCAKCGGETAYSEKWYVSVRMPDERGRVRKVRKAVSTNKQYAIEYEGKLLGKRGDGEHFESRKAIKLGKLVELFLEDCERRVEEGNLSNRTSDFYRQMLESFILPWFGRDVNAKKISELDIESYKTARLSSNRRVHVGGCKKGGSGETRELDRKIKPATVNRELSAMSAMFSFGVKRRLLPENPTKRVETLAENNRRDRFLEPEEIDRLIIECKTPHLKIAVMLALEAGLRLENCLSIKWSEVNFERNELVKVGKGGKEIRVPLTQKLRDALLVHKKTQKVKSISGYIIPSPAKHDEPMRIDADFGFSRACNRAKIKDFTFHCLRHTFVSLFLARTNGDIWTCAQIVGHSTSHMTERYGHLLDHRRREAMKKFEEG